MNWKLLPIVILLGVLISLPATPQTVPGDLVSAFRKGDARKLSAFFHQSLEMTILEEDYVSSKSQATRILEAFFRDHVPSQFEISFEGTKDNSKYAIGSLTTSDGTYRVNMFFLTKEEKRLIYYLSIEKESDYELSPTP